MVQLGLTVQSEAAKTSLSNSATRPLGMGPINSSRTSAHPDILTTEVVWVVKARKSVV